MIKIIKKHYSYSELKDYLICNFNHNCESKISKSHIDSCSECWNLWNRVRWDAAKESRGLLELKDYLGEDFSEYYDSSWALANEWNEQNPITKNEISNFYKCTKNYLFNLVIWYESGDRKDFHKYLLQLINEFSIKSVIDFGCGVGSDSLFLLEKNIKTYMVDFKCPSTNFLKWRIEKRNYYGEEFINVDDIKVLPEGEMFWAIDVLEHMPNPVEVVDMLSEKTKVFVHHSQFNNKSGGRHPCHIYFEEERLNKALIDKGYINIPWNDISVWVKKSIIE